MESSTSASSRSVEESLLHSSIHGYKDCHCKEPVISGTTDILVPSTKEEKSSSSSQSQNNSPSCSSCLGNASRLCEQIDPAEGLAEVETLIPGAQGRSLATSMKCLRHPASAKLDIEKKVVKSPCHVLL